MKIGSIHPAPGATRAPKRRGKGAATGLGGTAGKGHKGHKARTGGKIPAWFEGGQMPIQRRLPKRGFKPVARVEYQVLTAGRLSAAPAGTVVDRAWLEARHIVRRKGPVKLLAGGELAVALTLKVDAASGAGRAQVERAGGTVELPAARAAANTPTQAKTNTKAKAGTARARE